MCVSWFWPCQPRSTKKTWVMHNITTPSSGMMPLSSNMLVPMRRVPRSPVLGLQRILGMGPKMYVPGASKSADVSQMNGFLLHMGRRCISGNSHKMKVFAWRVPLLLDFKLRSDAGRLTRPYTVCMTLLHGPVVIFCTTKYIAPSSNGNPFCVNSRMDGPLRHRRASWEHKAVPLALAAMVPFQSDFAMFEDFFRSKWFWVSYVEKRVEEEQLQKKYVDSFIVYIVLMFI